MRPSIRPEESCRTNRLSKSPRSTPSIARESQRRNARIGRARSKGSNRAFIEAPRLTDRARFHPVRRLGVALMVYNIDSVGGMERQAAALARRLVARGARVSIITSHFPRSILDRWYERVDGIEVIRIPYPRWWLYSASEQ